jgi:DNA-binding MarR family transcriptional regulator
MNHNMAVLDMAGHLIRRLHQQSTQRFAQQTQAAGFDLTPVQFAALDAIQAHPGSDQSYVAEVIGYDRATIGGVIDRLEKKGWISRVVSTRDRRARELSLTSEGQQVLAELGPIVQGLQKGILHPLSEAEQQFFIHLTRRVVWQAEPLQGTSVPDAVDASSI